MELFGGKNDDGGAAEIARENARAAEQARAAEETRWQREQERIAKEKAEEQARIADEIRVRDEEITKQRQLEASQQAAQSVTGPTFDSGRANQAKLIAATQNTSGLPGFDALRQNRRATPNQSNSLVSQSGFNTENPGGRRYI